ncbi:hypothetical protein BOTBODRAFT_188394 [Botryobasidium botryosum FD-172 SS1]|uniref:Pre-mRNA-processing factor 17 n=1 Tax=Botryobasidium botryosum (strain FD-172 SS1) TaxID=930990 RepID=A0A067MQ08_BOTB1|nr:hypothetical protein BOTBODRAFT_188394 [Botryobasidium botryosum FD-172 SS1]
MSAPVLADRADSDNGSPAPSDNENDAFHLAHIPQKRARNDNPSTSALALVAAPDVALPESSLATRPTDTMINVNLTYEDMTRPVLGPENPFTERKLFLQNTLAGHVEEQSMTEHAFRTQHLAQSFDTARPSHQQTKALKRKRQAKGDLTVVEGEGSYAGPWASWEGENAAGELPDGVGEEDQDAEEDEEAEKEEAEKERRKSAKAKRSAHGQETSIFHGKSFTDYQGRTYMHPPLATAPHLASEAGLQETFIPKACVHTFTGHTQGVSVIRLFPQTGHLLLSGSMDTKIKLWDVYQEGNCLRTFMGHHKAVKDVTFSNDGRKFLSCGYDRQMKLWDTETGQCLKAFSNGKIPYVVRFHPDEDKQHIFLAGMSDKKIIQYDMNTSEIIQEYDQHLGPVNTITFVDDNRRFVTTSDDKTIRAWDYDIPVVIKYIAEPHMHSMPAVTLHPNKKWFAAQSLDNQILIYSTDNFRQNRKKRFAGHTVAGYACQVGFSPDGKWISSGDSDGSVVFWDWKNGKIKSRLRAHSKVVIAHEWLPHETSKLITASWDGLIKMWD